MAVSLTVGMMILSFSLNAGDKDATPLKTGTSPETWCDLFDYATLFEDDTARLIQGWALMGRYEGQWHYTDSNRGEDSGWENRRWRFGTRIDFLDDFQFIGQFNLKRDFSAPGRLFDSVEDLRVQWNPNDDFWMTAGKLKPDFTREFSEASFEILTLERSLLVDQIRPEKVGGIVGGVNDFYGFDLAGGLFSGARDENWLMPEFDGGAGIFASIGRPLTDATKLRLDYFHNDGDVGNDGFKNYAHAVSLNSKSQWGRWGLNTDLLWAEGLVGTSDVHGLMLMPWYDLSDKSKLVFRYQFAGSDGDNGIRLASRYERPAVEDGTGDRGDEYHAFYLGLNYDLCGNKLKIMNGVEYSTLSGASDFSGTTLFTGVRLHF